MANPEQFHKVSYALLLHFLQEVRYHFNNPNSGGLSYPDGIKSLADSTWDKICEIK